MHAGSSAYGQSHAAAPPGWANNNNRSPHQQQHHPHHHHHHHHHGGYQQQHHHHHHHQQHQAAAHHHHMQMHDNMHQHQGFGHHHHHHHHHHHQAHAAHHHHHHHHQHQPTPPQANNQPPPTDDGRIDSGNTNAFGFSIPVPQNNSTSHPLRPYFDSILEKSPDKDSEIGPYDLADALSEGTYKFSGGVAEKLVKMFDRSHSGKLDFNEYIAAHDFIEKMSHGFKQRDADNSGVLELGEVREALAASGYRLSEPCLNLLMKKFSDRRAGGLRFDQYTSLSILLARVTQIFGYYDRNRSGLVTFNFDSFFAALMSAL